MDSLDPFIHLWLSFNSWGMRVTGAESDAAMVRSLIRNRELSEEFLRLTRNQEFQALVDTFALHWPIFSVLHLRRLRIRDTLYNTPRDQRRAALLRSGAKRAPSDPRDPHQAPTWGEVLDATYLVRCNLIHGEKGDDEDDFAIVHAAFNVLFAFVTEARLYD